MLFNRQVGGILLVAGTCIGAGMLALPISTGPSGFFLSGIMIIAAWFMMLITGFLVAEVNIRLKGNASYISMAGETLGRGAKALTWICFLLLLYALMAAYIAGGSGLILSGIEGYLDHSVNHWFGLAPWLAIFGVLIYLGTKPVDVINKLLVVGLIVTYVALLVILAPHIDWQPSKLPVHSSYLWASLPILMASYGYHIVIPSVSRYLGHEKKALLRSIFWGSVLALVFYVIWQYFIFGILSEQGKHGLMSILHSGQPAASLTTSLELLSNNSWVGVTARAFACFALCSSFVGVAMGLFHLLADGLGVKESKLGKGFVALLTFIPPLCFTLLYPQGFIMALGYAGTLVAIIHGILPAMMAWSVRRSSGANDYRVFGGKLLLLVVIVLSLLVVGSEIAGHMGIIPLLW